MTEESGPGSLLGPLFEKAGREGLDYCVLRNYEGLPGHVPGSDVDVLVSARDARRFEELLLACAPAGGWTLERRFRKNYRITHLRLVRPGPGGGPEVLRFDLTSHIGLGPFRFVPGGKILSAKRSQGAVMAPSPADEQTINLLNALYNGTPLKKRYREIALRLAGEGPALGDALARFIGAELAREALDALPDEREAELAPRVRKRLRARACLRRPAGTLWDMAGFAASAVIRVSRPPGTFAALLGPDGIGKSTLARAVADELEGAFPGIETRHLRPGLLPELKRLLGRGGGEPSPSLRTAREGAPAGTIPSLVRLAYYGLDYTLGYWLRVRPALAKGDLILFDRYYFDYFVDQEQKAVALPQWLIRLACAFYPAPDRVFVLIAEAASVRARRADLSADEISRQMKAYEGLARWYPHIVTISADPPPKQVAKSIASRIMGLEPAPA